jgi:hypothetical protein
MSAAQMGVIGLTARNKQEEDGEQSDIRSNTRDRIDSA